MAFERDRTQPSASSFGTKGAMIDYSGGNVTLASNIKGIVVCAAGNLVYRAAGEASNAITVTAAPVGYIPPHIVGVVVQTGTTATLATIGD